MENFHPRRESVSISVSTDPNPSIELVPIRI